MKSATRSTPRSASKSKERQIRFAVVGLGYIAQIAVLPAFAHARNCKLAALVSDDPLKLERLGKKYDVPLRCSYDQYEDCLRSGEIDAVFLALPNTMHCDFTLRAARAGIHILCEKPMATSVADCREMNFTAAKYGVKLMIGYRLHFERANLTAVDIVKSGKLGDPRIFTSDFTMDVRGHDNIRLQKAVGGGTLWDIGIYCINAARYLFQSEPVEVAAWTAARQDPRFSEVEEMTSAVMRFPDERLASFTCSFGAASVSSYRIVGTKGDLRVEPAFDYAEDLVHTLRVGSRTRTRVFPKRDQFAPELLHFAQCIRENREPGPSGLEGLTDVKIIEALYRSAHKGGRPISIDGQEAGRRPKLFDAITRRAVERPKLVHAAGPSDED